MWYLSTPDDYQATFSVDHMEGYQPSHGNYQLGFKQSPTTSNPLTSILKETVFATTLIIFMLCTLTKGTSMMLVSITMKRSKMWSQQHPRIYSIQLLFIETRLHTQAIWLFNRSFSTYRSLLICILPIVKHHSPAMKWTSLSQLLN